MLPLKCEQPSALKSIFQLKIETGEMRVFIQNVKGGREEESGETERESQCVYASVGQKHR